MRWAQILGGVVKNVIVLDDMSLVTLFGTGQGFDYLIRIDNRTPEPRIGDTYDASTDTFTLL